MTKNVVVAGNPQSGKTTLVKAVAAGHPGVFGGFYTEDMRTGDGERRGFLIKTFDGKERVFASKNPSDISGGRAIKLKKYRVDIAALEGLAVPAADEAARENKIIVVDEIGAMEILSDDFRMKICEWLASPSRVLATVRRKSRAFTDFIEKRGDCVVLNLTRANAADIKNKAEKALSLIPAG